MTRVLSSVLVWGPRVFGVLVCLFIGMFALDAFSGSKPIVEKMLDFSIHLVPAAVMLGIVLVSWRRPWVGGLVFIGLGFAYIWMVNGRLDWSAVIAGPLFLVGLAFLASWWFTMAPRVHPGS